MTDADWHVSAVTTHKPNWYNYIHVRGMCLKINAYWLTHEILLETENIREVVTL